MRRLTEKQYEELRQKIASIPNIETLNKKALYVFTEKQGFSVYQIQKLFRKHIKTIKNSLSRSFSDKSTQDLVYLESLGICL